MKRFLYVAQVVLLGTFIFTITISLLQLIAKKPLSALTTKSFRYNGIEEYDPSLNRLNSIEKLEEYCDSLFVSPSSAIANRQETDQAYVELVYSVVKKRFYHGYSYYGLDNNYLAFLFSKVTVPGYSAIVIPNDILKHPNAACSQQSIVMMELLQVKGFKTRKVGFEGKKYGGHFCFEVFYKNKWHFYDPNLEPDVNVLNAYNRPGIAALVAHPDILLKAYKNQPKDLMIDIFPTYWYGPVNQFPAPTAIVFQKITKAFSYTLWFICLISFLFVRRIYRRITSQQHVWNSRVYFPQSQPGTSSSYYPGLTAPGA